MGVSHHCVVELSNIKTMLIGGQTLRYHHDYYSNIKDNEEREENLFSNLVWVFDWHTMEWKQMNRLHQGRHSHSCAQTLDKKLVVVVGGFTDIDQPSLDVEVFDVDTEEWRILKSSKLPWEVVGVPFILHQGVPTLLRSIREKESYKDDDGDDDTDDEMEASKINPQRVGLIQLSNNGHIEEYSSNFSSLSKVTIRSYGVLLIVPEVTLCF